MRFVVVADSHIRFPDDDVATYPSNALMADRNRHVVELCNELAPAFVVHLGDIVHPLPVEPGHRPAVQLASEVYAALDIPVHYVPGNHDIGDKPNALVAVPPVAEENYAVFEAAWGPPFKSFGAGGHHFVIVDTPVLNSGLAREAAQRDWLEADLAAARAAGRRIFMFSHYPPFVNRPDEDPHYDNLDQPARGWLLGLLTKYRVEALFSGHVHNFLYNHHEGTELYVAPSTGFVRPDYSELAAVPPESEGGRDDPAKLGFFAVEVTDAGHEIRPIRTYGSVVRDAPAPAIITATAAGGWRSPLGVTLRHGWLSEVDFPTAGLDEFRRKTVRNDAILPALWEARLREVRIPLADLAPERRSRLEHLSGRGMRFRAVSAGVPDAATAARVAAAADVLSAWEIVAPPADFAAVTQALAAASVPVPTALAPVVPQGAPTAPTHHFVTAGFDPFGDPSLDLLRAAPEAATIGEIVFRADPDVAIEAAVGAAAARAADSAKQAAVIVALPRAEENRDFDDDAAVADRVGAAARVALAAPHVAIFLDAFVDHDRGYYRRHGLIDRRFNPRPAHTRLIEIACGGSELRPPGNVLT